MYHKKILIIEDEKSIGDLLSYSLNKEGFITEVAEDGMSGMRLIKSFQPELIILDLMLPDMSGFDICKAVSSEYIIPIVMITARSDTFDKLLGIELGADDYITKPFDMREVIVRIKAIFRRIELTSESMENNSLQLINLGEEIEVNKDKREVLRNKEKVDLTNKEYDLLLFLIQNRGKVFSRSEILDKVWGFEFAGDTRTVDIHVQRLRKKLDKDKNLSIIKTVFGIGYKLV